ncbi:MAG TPA: DUF1801 domain-containing protein [Patescibacteria group bacterium]|nr:DUF1801 domain-containing protein [Patescibacteria group bacterium]
MQKAANIDIYIAGFPEDTQKLLKQIRKAVKEVAPDATEAISYGIPTFKLNGKNLVHFGGFSDHISFFPTGSGIEAFKKELGDHVTGKGTANFPLDEPLPLDLFKKIVKFRVEQVNKGNR